MNLEEYLDSRRISRNSFAKRVGVTQSAIGNYILGNRLPNLLVGRKIEIETAGEVRIDDLINFWKSLR